MARRRRRGAPPTREKGKKRNVLIGQMIVSLIIILLMIGAGKMNAAVLNQGAAFIKEKLAADYTLQEIGLMAKNTLNRGGEAVTAASSRLLGGGTLKMSAPADADGVRAASAGEDLTIHYQSEKELQVYAAAGGTVTAIEDNEDGTKSISVNHGDLADTVYEGCTDVYIRKLDRVKKGELLASAAGGAQGGLKFRVLEDGIPVEPSKYMEN